MFKKIRRWFSRPKDCAGHVYYAKLKTPQGIFYKLGYTSKPTLFERMSYGQSGDENLLDRQFFFTFRDDAWDVEQTLLDYFDRHRAFGKFSNDPKMPLELVEANPNSLLTISWAWMKTSTDCLSLQTRQCSRVLRRPRKAV